VITQSEVEDVVDDLTFTHAYGTATTLTHAVYRVLGRPDDELQAIAVAMAGRLAVGARLQPGETFHRLEVHVLTPGGQHVGSADDLPAPVRVLAQMVTALANGDRPTAEALWAAHVEGCRHCAQLVLIVAVKLLADRWRGGCSCPPGGHR
jgi:hypothetical protein